MVPEDRKLQGLLLGFPVEQNISLAVLARLTEHGFINSKEESVVSDRQIKALNVKTPSGRWSSAIVTRSSADSGAHSLV